MRTCRIYYVLIMLLASTICSRGEGWTPEAWSFTNTWSSTNAIATNNMFAVRVHQVITQQSSTNYIPAQSLQILFTGEMFYAKGLWNFPANSETGMITYTNEYFQKYHPFDYRITNRNIEQTFSITSGVVITTIQRSETGMITQVEMDVDTLRDYELYMAIWERARAIGTYSAITSAMHEVEWTHKNNRSNLSEVKEWIERNMQVFCALTNSKTTSSNMYDYSVYLTNKNNGGYYVTNIPCWKSVNDLGNTVDKSVLYSLGFPSNYLSYTPYKQLNTTVSPIGHIYTNYHVMTRYWNITHISNDVITNTIYLYSGLQTNVYGTNNQLISIIITNNNVEHGFTENDYGYYHITNILRKMINIPEYATWGTNSDYYSCGHDELNETYLDTYAEIINGSDLDNTNYWTYSLTHGGNAAGFGRIAYTLPVDGTELPRQFASYSISDNSIRYNPSTNIDQSLFVGYSASAYIAIRMPDRYSNTILSINTPVELPEDVPSVTLYGSNSIPEDIIYEYQVYTSSAYRGIVDETIITNATPHAFAYIPATDIMSAGLVSGQGIDPNIVVVFAIDEESSNWVYVVSSTDGRGASVGTKASFVESEYYGASFNRYTEFGVGFSYVPIIVRNYAVTNGFKYY